jgi:hypothetical protein
MKRIRIFSSITLTALVFAGSAHVATTAPAEIHPIVETSEHCLIGGSQNQKWISAGRFHKTLKNAETFELYTLEGPAGEVTLKRNAESECHESWNGKTNGKTASESKGGIAIQAPSWNVMPRLPRAIDPADPGYVAAVSDILKREGIKAPVVKITQAYAVDLDGDGKEEQVIVANRYAKGLHELSGVGNETSAGDYTLVVVRKTIDEKIQNIFLAKAVWLKANEGPLPRANHLNVIADLNGDGRMEFVFYSAYHEGSGSVVIQLNGSKATTVLECSCEH